MKEFGEYRENIRKSIMSVLKGEPKDGMNFKAAIITWCNNNGPTNYGQILQCAAVQWLLKDMGINPVTVLYQKIPGTVYESDLKRQQKFQEFINRYISVTKPCLTKQMVEKETADCDVLICGSDQIWNPEFYDTIYYLDFGGVEQKRIGLSVSGIFYDDDRLRKLIPDIDAYIKRFNYLSMRERVGVEILSGHTNLNVDLLPDPTLMLSRSEWQEMASEPHGIGGLDNYILCYFIGELSPFRSVIQSLAKKHNARVKYIPSNIVSEAPIAGMEPLKGIGPNDFLGMVASAKAVVTDSFHGVCMAYIFGVMCYCGNRVQKGGEIFGGKIRINNLKDEFGIDFKWIDPYDRDECPEFFLTEDQTMVSVVMPVYNGGSFIANALSDLQSQSDKRFELIVVNDGSSDDTMEVVAAYAEKDHRIHILSQEHKGAGAARNIGMKAAVGKYLLFLDSDDRFEHTLIEDVVCEAETYDTDILIFDAKYEDSGSGLETNSDHVTRRDRLPDKIVFSAADRPQTLLSFSFNVVWTKLYKREFIEKLGVCFDNLKYCEDVGFHHITLLEAERIHYFDKKLVRYQQYRSGNLSNAGNYEEYPECAVRATQIVKEYIESHGMDRSFLVGLIDNTVFRVSGIMDEMSDITGNNFERMYQMSRDELIHDDALDLLNSQEWVDVESKDWLKAIVENDEKDFIKYMLKKERMRYRHLVDANQNFSLRLIKQEEKNNTLAVQFETLVAHKHWIFDTKRIRSGSRVVIYGAGEVGYDFIRQFERDADVTVAAWVDKNYKEISRRGYTIGAPESVFNSNFDYVIIAIRSISTAKNIKRELSGVIPEKKILLMAEEKEKIWI